MRRVAQNLSFSGYEMIALFSVKRSTPPLFFLASAIFRYSGEQEWRSGKKPRLQAMCPGFRRHMRVEFVVGSLLCSERFLPGTPVFPSPQKPTFPNSNSILECTGISERVLANSLVLFG